MTVTQAIDIEAVRSQFPAMVGDGNGDKAAIFVDNPGGTQVPRRVIHAMGSYLAHSNANTGGPFTASQRTDQLIADARRAAADLLNAASPMEIAFGANMTTLTFSVARAIGRLLSDGDEIVTTLLDHDANVAPWRALERDRGVTVRSADIVTPDCTLDMAHLASLITNRTRLVAIGYASNATGTINDISRVVEMAHAAGAWVYVDAVQFAPHGLIDVQALKCDFLVCSAYKFYGPHLGLLYGKYDLLTRLPVDKVRPQIDTPPWRVETGTLNHEGIVGTTAAIDYLADLGRSAAHRLHDEADRRSAIVAAMSLIRRHEMSLFERLLGGIEQLPGVQVWGITDPSRFAERGPTLCFTWSAQSPSETAALLGRHGINAWDGDYYATGLMQRLNLAPDGAIRLGLAHYNTVEEVDRVIAVLRSALPSEAFG